MHTTYRQVRKFSSGDPDILCRGPSTGSLRDSILDQYLSFILEQLSLGIKGHRIYESLLEMGHEGKRTNFYSYCKKVIEKYDIDSYLNKNITGVPYNKERIKCHYINRNSLIKHLWSGKGVTDDEISYLLGKYPLLQEIKECIFEFRKIFNEKCIPLLHQFFDKYIKIGIKNLKSFANGITKDQTAVENAITSKYSNGFL